ncbi:NAD(P)H-hydrate dehydratase [Variovorax sp. J22P271]|uniref:NAD(P)H-hydrate dehydratase n=1 Tax=Variovorax davisae TaxID=3053515 RepID=UPI002578C3F6|nr:NAD(P)H-hydrate dehydratase [Variovorax sp. J22P271]MDM0032279.1 NAD(P)H-hydrate dehydratase [Variovorax sp. J22P271]
MAETRDAPLTEATLKQWPLPELGPDADKEGRGHVLVVAGSVEIPGAALLAATAALRVGELTIAAPERVASGLALAIPEARVIALEETPDGGFDVSGCEALAPIAEGLKALVMGPGMQDESRSVMFVRAMLLMFSGSTVILDALAMSVVREGPFCSNSVVLTPRAGEMAYLSGLPKEVVCEQPLAAAREAAMHWNALVALKGAHTHIAQPDGRAWRFSGGGPGLGTSGSGDTLAGLIGGFAARGLPAMQACAWGVLVHARAGAALARRHGAVGYLARELAGEVPALVHRLDRQTRP